MKKINSAVGARSNQKTKSGTSGKEQKSVWISLRRNRDLKKSIELLAAE